jgi:hypothetical protein
MDTNAFTPRTGVDAAASRRDNTSSCNWDRDRDCTVDRLQSRPLNPGAQLQHNVCGEGINEEEWSQ